MENTVRTDLAVEARELWRESAKSTTNINGVKARETTESGFKITTVEILNEQGAESLGKPVGQYVTFELDCLLRREENAFVDAANILADQLKGLLKLSGNETIFVTGLGNSAITPDAIGPIAINYTMVTRHLKERLPEQFAPFRQVSAIQAGVLGTTGMESADMIAAVSGKIKPDRVIAIDALASRRIDRVCRTLQLSDTGIVPGSGVGNSRSAINRESLGVPVVAIGVPTVVDASSLIADLQGENDLSQESIDRLLGNKNMIVTPRDIDKNVRDIAKLIGYGINLALHDGLTVEDVDMFLS